MKIASRIFLLLLAAAPLRAQAPIAIPAISASSCTPAMSQQTYADSTGASVTVINNVKVGESCSYAVTAPAGNYKLSVVAATTNPAGAFLHLEFPSGTNVSGPVSFLTPECCVGSAPTHFSSQDGPNTFALPGGAVTLALVVDGAAGAAAGSGAHVNIETLTLTFISAPPPPPPLQIAFAGCCTITFPIANASQVPSCTAADGVCSIAIQICDAAVPANCLSSNAGKLSLIKTSTLPTPQVLTVPVAIAVPGP